MPLEGIEEWKGCDEFSEALLSRSPEGASRITVETPVDPGCSLVAEVSDQALGSSPVVSSRVVGVRGECSDVHTAQLQMTVVTRFRSVVGDQSTLIRRRGWRYQDDWTG